MALVFFSCRDSQRICNPGDDANYIVERCGRQCHFAQEAAVCCVVRWFPDGFYCKSLFLILSSIC